MEQYEIAISNKFQKEFATNFHSKNEVICCISQFRWERQYQNVSTHSMLKKVKDEIKLMLYCEQQADIEFP